MLNKNEVAKIWKNKNKIKTSNRPQIRPSVRQKMKYKKTLFVNTVIDFLDLNKRVSQKCTSDKKWLSNSKLKYIVPYIFNKDGSLLYENESAIVKFYYDKINPFTKEKMHIDKSISAFDYMNSYQLQNAIEISNDYK